MLPGPQNCDFVAQNLMPVISQALTQLLRDQPEKPVTELVQLLRQLNPKRGFRAAELESSLVGRVDLVSRPPVISEHTRLPSNFSKAGEYPVYAMELPQESTLGNVIDYLVDEEHVEHIDWFVVSAEEVLCYLNHRPYRGTLKSEQWNKVTSERQFTADHYRSVEKKVLQSVTNCNVRDVETVIRSCCEKKNDLLKSASTQLLSTEVERMQHASEVAVTVSAMDLVTTACDRLVQPNSVVVVCGCDRWNLIQHFWVLTTLYFRIQREMQQIRRLLRMMDHQLSKEPPVDITLHEKELFHRRKHRDAMRDALYRSHLQGLIDRDEEETVDDMIKRQTFQESREERRKKEDGVRQQIMLQQGTGAAIRVQSFVRGMMARRRNPVSRKNRRTAEDADLLCKKGRFPIIEMTLQVLSDTFGPDMISMEVPKRGGTRPVTNWFVNMKKIPPVDDVDVSSEEEEWESETTEKVTPDLSAAFNPLHDVDYVYKVTKSCDVSHLYDIYRNFGELSVVQRRAFQTLERYTMYVIFAAYLSFHHKRNESLADTLHLNTQDSSFILRVPSTIQNSQTFEQFLHVFSMPLEWLSHAQFTSYFFGNIPKPLLLHRLLLGNSTPNGSFIPDVTGPIYQRVHPVAPIYFVPECLSMDQWIESAAAIVKAGSKKRKLLWIQNRPDFTVYINGVPFYSCERYESHTHGTELKTAETIRNAEINPDTSSIPEPDLSVTVKSPNVGGGGSVYDLHKLKSQIDDKRAKEINCSWFGVEWDQVEQQLASDVKEAITEDSDGQLSIYSLQGTYVPSDLMTVTEFDLVPSEFREMILENNMLRVLRSTKQLAQVLRPLRNTPLHRESTALSVRDDNNTPNDLHTPTLVQPLMKEKGRGGRVNRKQSFNSHANSEAEDKLEEVILPSKASEAVRTPKDAAEEVRARLRRVHNVESTIIFRRIPLMTTFGFEWLTVVDQLYAQCHEFFADANALLAFNISGADSVFMGILTSLIWAVEYNTVGAFGQQVKDEKKLKKGPPTPAEALPLAEIPAEEIVIQKVSRPSSAAQSEDLIAGSESEDLAEASGSKTKNSLVNSCAASVSSSIINQVQSFRSAGQRTVDPKDQFPVLRRLAKENSRLDVPDGINFIDLVLLQTNTDALLYHVIEFHMEEAKKSKTEQQMRNHQKQAVCAFERYTLLVLFYCFLKVAQEQRQMMSVMQVDSFSFRQFMGNNPQLLHFLEHLNPWEGRTDGLSPMGLCENDLTGNQRWRRRTWLSSIG